MKLVRRPRKLREILTDETGQATLEWMLVLLAFIIPMIVILNMLLNTLIVHYRVVTFLETLPFP